MSFQCFNLLDWYRDLFHNRRLVEGSSYEVLDELMAQFLARIECLLRPETWASWTLTRPGRHFLRALNALLLDGPALDIPVELTENPVASDIRRFLQTACENDFNQSDDAASSTICEDADGCNLESNDSFPDQCVETRTSGDDGASTIVTSLRQQIAARRDQSLEQKLSCDLRAYTYEKSIETVDKFIKVLHPSVEGRDAFLISGSLVHELVMKMLY